MSCGHEAESAALREEVGRLRGALAMFDGSSDGVCPVCSYPVDECDNAMWTCKGRIVRRALASPSPAAPAVPGSGLDPVDAILATVCPVAECDGIKGQWCSVYDDQEWQTSAFHDVRIRAALTSPADTKGRRP